MANNCMYEMKIKGTRENCEKWICKMESYDEKNHFWRIFSSAIVEESGTEDLYEMYIDGDCAWSLYSCCIDGYTDYDLFAVNTKELNLEMECWSEEPGIGFQEHYLYQYGNKIIDNEQSCDDTYQEIYCGDKDEFPTYKDIKKAYPDAPSEIELEENDWWFSRGGFKDYGQWHI